MPDPQNIDGSYPGGKRSPGVFHAIINQMPPHETYVELFLGGGAVFMAKRKAKTNIGVEIDPDVCRQWQARSVAGLDVQNIDAMSWLSLAAASRCPSTLIYADPPYLLDARTCKEPRYRHELTTWEQHIVLLERLRDCKAMVIVSGYDHAIYNANLIGWRKVQFQGMSRGGPRLETIWCNFDHPGQLHDYRYLGKDYRERQDLKRQKDRWLKKLDAMPTLKRQMLMAAIDEHASRSGSGGTAESSAAAATAELPPATSAPLPARAASIDESREELDRSANARASAHPPTIAGK